MMLKVNLKCNGVKALLVQDGILNESEDVPVSVWRSLLARRNVAYHVRPGSKPSQKFPYRLTTSTCVAQRDSLKVRPQIAGFVDDQYLR